MRDLCRCLGQDLQGPHVDADVALRENLTGLEKLREELKSPAAE